MLDNIEKIKLAALPEESMTGVKAFAISASAKAGGDDLGFLNDPSEEKPKPA